MIIVFKFAELFHIAVKFQQGACYQFESVNADEIAEIAAEDTGDGCNAGNFVCFFGRSQNHRDNHNVRGNREERTFNKRDDKKPCQGIFAGTRFNVWSYIRRVRSLKAIVFFLKVYPTAFMFSLKIVRLL